MIVNRVYNNRGSPFHNHVPPLQIIFYSPVLFASLGSSQKTALLSTVIVGVVNVVSTLVAVFGVDRLGRRVLLLEAGVQVRMHYCSRNQRVATDIAGQ